MYTQKTTSEVMSRTYCNLNCLSFFYTSEENGSESEAKSCLQSK